MPRCKLLIVARPLKIPDTIARSVSGGYFGRPSEVSCVGALLAAPFALCIIHPQGDTRFGSTLPQTMRPWEDAILGAKDSKPSDGSKGSSPFLKISALLFLVVIIYVAYIFYSRAQRNRPFEERAAEEKALRAAADQKAVQGMGGDKFEILNFYADPAAISKGDATDLCYGVSNASTVTLQPQSNAVWPAFSKCVSVSPRKTTEYTLTATSPTGEVKTSKVTVPVR
jgi:hypothetical protein